MRPTEGNMIFPFIFLIIVKLLIKITMKFFQSNINFNIYVKTLSYPRHKVFCVFFIVRFHYLMSC